MRRELLKCGEVRTPNDLPRDAGKNQTGKREVRGVLDGKSDRIKQPISGDIQL